MNVVPSFTRRREEDVDEIGYLTDNDENDSTNYAIRLVHRPSLFSDHR